MVRPAANPPPKSTTASTAAPMTRPLMSMCDLLFVSQGLDRMEARRAKRGVQTEDDADGHRDADRDGDRRRGHDRQHAGLNAHDLGDAEAERDADDASSAGERDGLDQELRQHVTAPGADGLADADLPRPFGDGHEHDVHDPDP